nr:hypothetical protein [Campylobacter troglodytis]
MLPIIKDFAELNECEIYRKASKAAVPWLIFYNAMPLPLQEGARVHYRVKHNKKRVCKWMKPHKRNCEFFCFVLQTRKCKQKWLC